MKEINHEVDSLLVWSFPAIKQTLKEEALFQTHGKLEHLALMKRVLGPLPQAQQYCYVKESNIVNKVSGYGTKIVSSERTSMLAGGGDSDGEGSSLSSIQVVDRAHAVVLAGGTLQPIEETREREKILENHSAIDELVSLHSATDAEFDAGARDLLTAVNDEKQYSY